MNSKISSVFVLTIGIAAVILNSVSVNGSYYPSSTYGLSDSNSFQPFVRECTWMVKENPEDCQSYFQCRHGQSILRRCPRQLAWNTEFGICDWEAKAKCKAKKKITSFPGKSDTRRKGFQYPKSCPPGALIPGPTCGQFYSCDGSSKPHLQSCTPGLYFNPSLGVCDWPYNVDCSASGTGSGSGIESIPESPSTSTTTERPSIPESPTSSTTVPTTERPTWTTSSTLPPFFSTSTTTTTAMTTTTTSRPSNPAPTTYPILIPNSDFICVCYFGSWSAYRRNGGKFQPSFIDPSKCTHIVYAFAQFSATTYEMEMMDPYIDGPDGLNYYEQITSFTKYGVTPMIAIGGWNDSGNLKWNDLLSDPEKIKKFGDSVKRFLKKYGFKGIDIDLEYPACLQGNCAANHAHQREGFIVLMKYLKMVLGDEYLITIAISCNENIIKVAYDLLTLSHSVNWFNVMAYDYHGSWEKFTGHVAPLMPASDKDPNAYLTVQHSVEMILGMGVPREKLCLGIPTYGTTYTLADAQNHGLNAPVIGPGEAGNMTNTKGMMSYGEICQQNFKVVERHPQRRWGPYKVRDNFWVSHDDQDMIRRKCDFIMEYGLLGAMVWSIDLDDFQGYCTGGKEKFACLGTINQRLRGPKGTMYTHKWRKIREEEKRKTQQKQRKRTSRSRSRRRRN